MNACSVHEKFDLSRLHPALHWWHIRTFRQEDGDSPEKVKRILSSDDNRSLLANKMDDQPRLYFFFVSFVRMCFVLKTALFEQYRCPRFNKALFYLTIRWVQNPLTVSSFLPDGSNGIKVFPTTVTWSKLTSLV